ncbi:MAG: 50S ribosomal protein L18 [Endomicrobiales bacterium]|nr:50S ribosomal protein L18 [Endomicrobiales bacterium]
MKGAQDRFNFRKKRIRSKIFGSQDRPRLSVYRGYRHIYAQLVNDDNGHTLVAVSTLSPELKGKLKSTDTLPAAKAVGELIAKKAMEKGIKKIIFDRSGYMYAGRIKELADAARKIGLEF